MGRYPSAASKHVHFHNNSNNIMCIFTTTTTTTCAFSQQQHMHFHNNNNSMCIFSTTTCAFSQQHVHFHYQQREARPFPSKKFKTRGIKTSNDIQCYTYVLMIFDHFIEPLHKGPIQPVPF